MRKPDYLSPSSVRSYFEKPEEFYIRYLAETKVPRAPQTQPMSIGSAFDAFVKSYLHEALFGKGNDLRFDRTALFEAQVEPHNRDWAVVNGQHAFEIYKELGSLADLMLELKQAVGKPRFEIEIRGHVEGNRGGKTITLKGLPLLGKPDVFYINKAGHSVILDWKVNGWCSKHPISPMKGYINLRGDRKKSGHHKDCHLQQHQGQMINGAMYLEDGDEDWASQLATYGWLCGEEIGSQFITAIDQFACAPDSPFPKVRVAEHRLRVSYEYQWKVFTDYMVVAKVIDTGNLYPDKSDEDNKSICLMLDEKAKMLAEMMASGTPEDKAFRELCGMDVSRPY